MLLNIIFKGSYLSNTIIQNNDLDFFGDAIVYRTSDEWGDILVVEHANCRDLIFGLIYQQSTMDMKKKHVLVHEYTRAMMLVLLFIKPRHATILGLGGGCLLRSLHHLLPDCKLHAVELRQRVYDVACEFFGIPISKKIVITIADAKLQLADLDDSSTNIIFADMYHAYRMNPFQLQKIFIDHCDHVLSDRGWLVVNYHEMLDTSSDFFEYLSSLFDDVLVCQIPGGNNIIFACKYSIGELHHFEARVASLEKQLKIKLMHLFKRLTRLSAS